MTYIVEKLIFTIIIWSRVMSCFIVQGSYIFQFYL